MNTPGAFRGLLTSRAGAVVPSAFDVLSARIIEDAGFAALHLSGFFTAGSLLGLPDIGFISGVEMAEVCQRITAMSSIPVFVDADDGYGGPLQVYRTVRSYELAGASGLHLEDQTAPKRCGLMSGKTVIPTEQMEQKIHAALDARMDENFVVVARTDAKESEGLDQAIERAGRYRAAGADAVLVEGLSSLAEHEKVASSSLGPLIGAWSPFLPADVTLPVLRKLGYAIIMFIDAPLAVHYAYGSILEAVKADVHAELIASRISDYDAFNATVRLDQWRSRESLFDTRLGSAARVGEI